MSAVKDNSKYNTFGHLEGLLQCECGFKSIQNGTAIEDIENGSIAQYIMADKGDSFHYTFDRVSLLEDFNGGIWHEFNGGALPICPKCWTENLISGLFVLRHDSNNCTTGDCGERNAKEEAKAGPFGDAPTPEKLHTLEFPA